MVLKKEEKDEIKDAIWESSLRIDCVRCKSTSHKSNKCRRSARDTSWGNFSSPADAEHFYQVELNDWIVKHSANRMAPLASHPRQPFSDSHRSPAHTDSFYRSQPSSREHRPHNTRHDSRTYGENRHDPWTRSSHGSEGGFTQGSRDSTRRDRDGRKLRRSNSPENRDDDRRGDSRAYRSREDPGRYSNSETRRISLRQGRSHRTSTEGYLQDHPMSDAPARPRGGSERDFFNPEISYEYTDRRDYHDQIASEVIPRSHLPKSELAGAIKNVSGAGDETVSVLTNYFKINSHEIPKEISVYALKYSYKHTNSGDTIVLTKPADMQCAFEAGKNELLSRSNADTNLWATNLRNLWIVGRLPEATAPFSVVVPHVTLEGGSIKSQLVIEGKLIEVLSNISQQLKDNDIRVQSRYLDALNALVTRPIYDQSTASLDPNQIGKLTQLGANRFFINDAFGDMAGLRAHRGYTVSVRPGADFHLLNVNTTSTAFFPQWQVSDMLHYFK